MEDLIQTGPTFWHSLGLLDAARKGLYESLKRVNNGLMSLVK